MDLVRTLPDGQTSVPTVDAPGSARGGLSLGYFDDDLPALISQGAVTTRFTVTTGGRRKMQTSTDAAGAVTSTLEQVYTDDSDNPAWIVSDADGAGPQGPSTTRFAESIAGDLRMSLSADGGLSLTVAKPRGDAVAGVEIPAGQSECARDVDQRVERLRRVRHPVLPGVRGRGRRPRGLRLPGCQATFHQRRLDRAADAHGRPALQLDPRPVHLSGQD